MTGLSSREVEDRIQRGLDNVQVNSSTRTVKEIVKENVFTYFNLIFTVLGVLLVIVGSFKDLSFMLIVLANTVIGIAQEIRSKQTLDKLKLLKMPKSHVVRDGREKEVAVEKLVLDDIIILRAGSQIPADAQVVEGSVQVNEALITGESDEITKPAGAGLLSGSFVVSGECLARLTAVGRDSYISKLTLEATKDKKTEESEMIKSLDKMVRVIGIIIIPVGAVLLGTGMVCPGGRIQRQRHIHGSRRSRDDTRGPLHDRQHSHGDKRHETCAPRRACAEHEMYRNSCACRRSLRGQDRHHNGERNESGRLSDHG